MNAPKRKAEVRFRGLRRVAGGRSAPASPIRTPHICGRKTWVRRSLRVRAFHADFGLDFGCVLARER